MIINKLTLRNFGIFYKTTSIDFSLQNEKNHIILLGGKNGSGKTTLLQAIKLALYGPLVLGYKTTSKRYSDFLVDKFNIFSLKEWDNSSSVTLNFTLKQAGTITTYEIERLWDLAGDRVIENVFIRKNNAPNPLDEKESSDFEAYLRKYIPPALFDFFFFDGEEIRDLIIQEDFEDKLKESALTLFNLDVFDILKEDLEKYLERENVFKELSKEEQAQKTVLNKITDMEEKISQTLKSIHELEKQIEDRRYQIDILESEFMIHGGLLETEISKLRYQITDLENEKRQSSEWLKTFAGDLLPFVICKDLLGLVQNQLYLEKEVLSYTELSSKFNQDLAIQIRNKLSEHKLKLVNGSFEEQNSEYFAQLVVSELTKSLKPDVDVNAFELLHNLSQDCISQIISLAQETTKFDPTSVQKHFDKINHNNETIHDFKNRISLAVENHALSDMWQKRGFLEKELASLNDQLLKAHAETNDLEYELEQNKLESEKLAKKIEQASRDQNAFLLSKRMERILNRYIEKQIDHKIKEVEKHFLDMFKNLIRKDNFIDRIHISEKSFKVELYSKGKIIPKKSLSAGEKQIYILSLLWAFIKASNRQIPLIFDTLLGRLDHSHKANIVTQFLPRASEQTIILSTDTEIDDQYYKLLKPHIAREFLLNYNEDLHSVEVSNEYFLAKEI